MVVLDKSEIAQRWPRIARFLYLGAGGWVELEWARWIAVERWWHTPMRAAAYEEWADFFACRARYDGDGLVSEPCRRQWAEMAAACLSAAAGLRTGAAFGG